MKLFFSISLLLCSILQAQLKTSISLKHREYIQHERVALRISFTNNSGQSLTLEADPWIDLFVERTDGTSLRPGFEIQTPSRQLAPNQSVTFEANLTEMFDISKLGRYSVFLVASPQQLTAPVYSNRARFEIQEARIIKTEAPLSDGSDQIEFRLLEFPRFDKDYLYLQCYSITQGRPLNTVGLGSHIKDYKPSLRIDTLGDATCFFRQNQTYFVHAILSKQGGLELFEHYTKASATKNPYQVITDAGEAAILHGIKYDREELARQALELKKLSERPLGF